MQRIIATAALSLLLALGVAGCPKPVVQAPDDDDAAILESNNSDGNNGDGSQEQADSLPANDEGEPVNPPEPVDATEPTDPPVAIDAGDAPPFVAELLPLLVEKQFAAVGVDMERVLASEFVKSLPPKMVGALDEETQMYIGAEKMLENQEGHRYRWIVMGRAAAPEEPPTTTNVDVFVSSEKLQAAFEKQRTPYTEEDLKAYEDLDLPPGVAIENPVSKTYNGREYFEFETSGAAIFTIGDHTMVRVDQVEAMKQVVDFTDSIVDTPLTRKLTTAPADAHIFFAGDITPVRDMLAEKIAELAQGPLTMLAGIPKQVNSFQIALNLDGDPIATVEIEATDADNAEHFKQMVEGLVAMGDGFLKEAKPGALESGHPLAPKLFVLGEQALAGVAASSNDQQVAIALKRPAELANLGSLLATLDETREQVQYLNFAKSMAREVLTLTVAAGRKWEGNISKDGKDMLSWRGRLYWLEEPEDIQPWDSEIYAELNEKGYELFGTPSTGPSGKMTTWKWVGGDPANIMILDAGAGTELPWLKPDDFQLNQEDPAKSLGGEPEGGYIVIFMNGSVNQYSREELIKLIKGEPGVGAEFSGKVILSGEPVADAEITIVSTKTRKPLATTKSGDDGAYSVKIPPGDYVLVLVKKDGLPEKYQAMETTPLIINVSAGEQVFDIALE